MALAASLYALALAARWVPLLFSPLPFNIDGFPLASIAQQIGATGTWQIGAADVNRYNELMPVYSLLWSAVAQLGDLSPLTDLQVIMPILTATVVFPAYLLGVKATRQPLVGFAAGLFVALFGSFLFVTSAAILASSAAVTSFSAKATGHRRPSSRCAWSLKPNVAYLDLNFCAVWK